MSDTRTDLTLFDVEFQAMGTRCTISLYADSSDNARSQCEVVIADVARLENKYSRYLSDSFLSEINAVAEVVAHSRSMKKPPPYWTTPSRAL